MTFEPLTFASWAQRKYGFAIPAGGDGEIQEISFLGGLLHGYRWVKQAA